MAAPCTWDPAHIGANITLSNANMTWVSHNSGGVNGRATLGYLAGAAAVNVSLYKYYEVTILNVGTTNFLGCEVGITNELQETFVPNDFLGGSSFSTCLECISGFTFFVRALSAHYFSSAVADTVGVAVDFFHQKVWYTKDGATWNNGLIAAQNPVTNAGGFACNTVFQQNVGGPHHTVYPAFGSRQAGPSSTGNFGATPFVHPLPTGFAPWIGYDETMFFFLLSP